MAITGNFVPSEQPTREEPHRAICPDVGRARVDATYQCVVDLPESPTRADLYRAFAESGIALCSLAAEWSNDKARSGELSEGGATTSYRVVVDMRLIPEEKREPRV